MEINRYGVVTIVPEPFAKNSLDCRYLVIERSARVIAPGQFCFPGGGIELDETPEQAAVREFREELQAEIAVVRPLWESVTPWQVHLTWFLCELIDPHATLTPSPDEVASFCWWTLDQVIQDSRTLASSIPFCEKVKTGKIDLSF